MRLLLMTAATMLALSCYADDAVEGFSSDERLEEGFLTHYVNKAVASGMDKVAQSDKVEYGRDVTDFVSPPRFGGYFIGKYAYTDQDGKHSGDGFSQRLIRLYVDGRVLKDFAYRIQIQANNSSFHMKDFYVEWQKYKALRVKVGQFKRAFGLENPLSPWDVGTGDYSQLTKKLTGFGDFIGVEAASNGGRDQGLQVQGDFLPVGDDARRLLHYQVMVANGQGTNSSDADSRKDVLATLQVQPVKGLCLGVFGWTGSYTYNDVTVNRNRYMFSAKYDRDDWTFRAEYAHSTGHKVSDCKRQDDGTLAVTGAGSADAWYATLGVPCTPWFKTYLKYDTYRDDATWSTAKSIYSVCPNFQLHKNLMFQVQYNYVHDRASADKGYSELWAEAYVRF
ncbi:MAG: porin [Prevotellaceae bacterium]|nr:porin [Prevotellaceae bacterium]MDO4931365.1 porin [Prevotellaceae bacterium]